MGQYINFIIATGAPAVDRLGISGTCDVLVYTTFVSLPCSLRNCPIFVSHVPSTSSLEMLWFEYRNREYYDRNKVAGFEKFRHIFPGRIIPNMQQPVS